MQVDVSTVADGIHRIRFEVKGVAGFFNVYLVEDEESALIEVGPTAAVPKILEGLKKLDREPESVSYIIPTHIHMDHGGGSGYLVQHHIPQATVVVHKNGAPHMVNPFRLVAGTRAFFGEDFEETFGPILPVPDQRLQVVEGGEIISLGSRELMVIYAPGHASHQISILDSKTRSLFCGEALGHYRPGSAVLVPSVAPPRFDLDRALETTEKLEKLAPAIILYSHDGIRREIGGLFESVRASMRRHADIIRKGITLGETSEQIATRLESYYSDAGTPVSSPHKVNDVAFYRRQTIGVVEGYTAYFKLRDKTK